MARHSERHEGHQAGVSRSCRREGRSPTQQGKVKRCKSVRAVRWLNTVIQAYNVARDAWLTYRGAASTNTPSDQYLQQLMKNLTDLTGALEALKGREAQARQRAASREEVKP